MARKASRKATFPTTFVGSFYDREAGVYIATRADGSVTVGQTGKRGVNVAFGGVFPGGDSATVTEH